MFIVQTKVFSRLHIGTVPPFSEPAVPFICVHSGYVSGRADLGGWAVCVASVCWWRGLRLLGGGDDIFFSVASSMGSTGIWVAVQVHAWCVCLLFV